ncbi:MAG: sigma-E factor negative regulatory protein [Pseudomonadota bacterium]
MTDTVEQQVSAFVDGELSAAESELFLKRLAADERLQARVSSYHTIGSVLRGERSVAPGFAQGIAVKLGEDSSQEQEERTSKTWRHYLTGGAIAATVATLALVGLNQSVQPDSETIVAEELGVSSTSGDTEIYTVPAPSNASVNPGLAEPQLVNYMLRHGRVTPLITRTDLGTSWVPAEQADEPSDDAEQASDEGVSSAESSQP